MQTVKDLTPSIETWEKLYQVAIKFREIGCWNWMWDTDIFGVQNPLNNEIGYCCVLGGGGEHFGLAVYLGTEGLEGYLKICSGEVSPKEPDAFYCQKCLMASFEDRRFLKEPDLEIIRRLGLKFRGKNSWPLFRKWEPGYLPWYLTQEEAEYLTLALQQTINVALRLKENPSLLTTPQEGYYLVRVKKNEQWIDKWLAPQPKKEKIVKIGLVDKERLEKIKKSIKRRGGILEIDFFYFPIWIQDPQRPYFPYGFLVVEHYSGFILDSGLMLQSELFLKFPNQFLDLLEKSDFLPNEILVKREEVFKLLEPIALELEIKLNYVKKLEALEQVRKFMSKFF